MARLAKHENRSKGDRGSQPQNASTAIRGGEREVTGREAALRAQLAEVVGTIALTFVAAGGAVMGAISAGAVSLASEAVAPGIGGRTNLRSRQRFRSPLKPVRDVRIRAAWRVPFAVGARLLGGPAIGSLTAALLLSANLGTANDLGATHSHFGLMPSLAMELVLTFLLIVVVLGTASRYSLIGTDARCAGGRSNHRVLGPLCGPSQRRLHESGAVAWAGCR